MSGPEQDSVQIQWFRQTSVHVSGIRQYQILNEHFQGWFFSCIAISVSLTSLSLGFVSTRFQMNAFHNSPVQWLVS
jgi:hypothetical protein